MATRDRDIGVRATAGLVLLYFLLLHVAAFAEEPPTAISLTMELPRTTAYVGEKIPVVLTLRVSGGSVSNIGYPTTKGSTVGIGKFPPPELSEEGDSTIYRFIASGVAERPGTFAVGPAEVTCDLLERVQGSAAYFGKAEPRKIIAASPIAELRVLPLPNSERPSSFFGAIGHFSMSAVGKPDTVAPEEPLTVVATIKGDGGLAEAGCPSVSAKGARVYPPVARRRGERELTCEQVVIPLREGPLPALEWSFFDPSARTYRTLTASLPAVRRAGRKESAAPPAKVLPATKGPLAAPPRRQDLSAWLMVAALFPIAGGYHLLRRKRKTPAPDADEAAVTPVHQLATATRQAALRGDAEEFYSLLFATLQEIVAHHYGISAAAVSGLPDGADIAEAEKIASLLSRCHSVRYGGKPASAEEMASDLKELSALLALRGRHPSL